MKDKPTELLVRQAKKRDPDAFTDLMDSQGQNMYRIARSILCNDEDAADAIQETILVCWEKLDTLREEKFFKTWMTKILINNCYKIIRQDRNITYMDALPDMAAESDTHTFEWDEALSMLNEKYRLIVTLFYSQGLHTKEIAKLLGIPDNTVRTRLAKAREQLKSYYEE